MIKKTLLSLSILAVTVSLSACGGGDDDNNNSNNKSLAGLWKGDTTSGYNATMLILNDGQTHGMYTKNGLVVGMFNGYAFVNANNLNAEFNDLIFPNSSKNVKLSGVAFPNSKITAIAENNSNVLNFNFDNSFNNPVGVANIVGEYAFYGQSNGIYSSGNSNLIINEKSEVSFTHKSCSGQGNLSNTSQAASLLGFSMKLKGCIDNTDINGYIVIDNSTSPKTLQIFGYNLNNRDGLIGVANYVKALTPIIETIPEVEEGIEDLGEK